MIIMAEMPLFLCAGAIAILSIAAVSGRFIALIYGISPLGKICPLPFCNTSFIDGITKP